MQERTAPYNLCHSHRGRERWQGYIWWWNRWLAECTACSKKSEKSAEGSVIQGLFTAHRIAPPILPLRERSPPTLIGTSPCPSPSMRDKSTEPISVLPLRARPPGLMSAVRCRAMPALRCGLLTALSPLFATLKLLRRRRKREVPTPPGAGDVGLALLDARPREAK